MKAQVVVTVAVRAALLTIALTAVAAAGLPQAAASAQGGPQPKQASGAPSASHVAARSGTVPDSYIVSLRSGDAGVVAAEQAGRDGASVTHVFRSAMRGYAARMTPAQAARVAADSRVAAVVPDRYVSMAAQSVPSGIDRIGADKSYTASGDGAGSVDVDVAIIDTGIDRKHRDLNVVGGVNCVPGNLPWDDRNGHGTHVSGTVAAKDNKGGVVGVVPGARLWSVRVLDSQGAGTWSSIICGVDWVTAHASTIEVANMSLGGSGTEGSCTDGGLREAICKSVAAGVTYVVAAGNESSDAQSFVPATYPEVITVSAIADFDGLPGGLSAPQCSIGTDDTFASFSNFGSDVDLTAPGVCVRSTWLGGGYATLSGTSMATPHVTGAAALYKATHPTATPAQVKAALVAAGTHDWKGDPDGVQEPLVDVAGF
ncbi:MAG TPA: S8 family serine peptidase [Pedococcus sp.]|nr:S8 family serine peptidase [Pedococcus sp.]